MLNRMSRLFRKISGASHGDPATELPERSFPNAANISNWDDQGLYVATGCEAAIRHHNDGFETLNDAEQFLCCFYLLESDVNNGGVGHWIESLCPLSAAQTPLALRQIGANEMSIFTENALEPLGDVTQIGSRVAWVDHYLAMPDAIHEHWETLTPMYCRLEDGFLELAYAYGRANWSRVRGPKEK